MSRRGDAVYIPWRWRVKPNVGYPALPPPGEPMDDGFEPIPKSHVVKPSPDSVTSTTVTYPDE